MWERLTKRIYVNAAVRAENCHLCDMIETDRLRLRPWQDDDRPAFAAMNKDADVRRYFPNLQTEAESNESVDRFVAHDRKHGFTFWAAELLETGAFIGFVGLVRPAEYLPITGEWLEIGWRLSTAHWGKGLATEAARACTRYAFGELAAPRVGAITTASNAPSINVMKKLGMTYQYSFMHPKIEVDDPIAEHVFYAMSPPPPPSESSKP